MLTKMSRFSHQLVALLLLLTSGVQGATKRTTPKLCRDDPSPEVSFARADVIISGQVRRLERHAQPNRSNTVYAAYITVIIYTFFFLKFFGSC
jgi:hypothetical protein